LIAMSMADEEADLPPALRELGLDLLGGPCGIAVAQVQTVQVGEWARRIDGIDQCRNQGFAVEIHLAEAGASHLRVLKIRGARVLRHEHHEDLGGAQVLKLSSGSVVAASTHSSSARCT